jgi:hypothetical protein
MKQCKLCLETKGLEFFSKNSRYKDGYYKHCRKCHYSVYGRDSHLRNRYGITEIEYHAMLEKQGYKCKVCGQEHKESRYGRIIVDHDHETGKIRGLLCQPCNMTLGTSKDNIETLKGLIKYLEDHYGTRTEV